MSTAEIFLESDEIADFIRRTLASDSLYVIGEDDREIGICPFISFYIYNKPDQFVSLSEQIFELFKEFEASIIDEPFQLVWHGWEQEWLRPGDPRLPDDVRAYALAAQDAMRPVWIQATDMESEAATARWSFNGMICDGVGDSYTRLKINFRERWYRKNAAQWHAFVQRCLQLVQPDHCYSGFEVGNGGFNILGAYECDVLERICADYFFGMDIDHPGPMHFHNHNRTDTYFDEVSLGAGIRTPTWCFMLSPYWQAKLGKTEAQIRAELDDPRIEITSIPYEPNAIYPQGGNGLWIRLGELDLYPVERGLPDLLVKANRLIRPIRCDHLQLLTLDPWDDDPNPRFDFDSSLRWMRRFDDDSDWPSADRRHGVGGPGADRATSGSLRAMPGEPAPRGGWWRAIALTGPSARVHVASGQLMPGPEVTALGRVIWQFDEDQGA